ncbi:hypothetical protein GCM10022255_048700 [Dactylosporangium darangshiense]|uniref:Uncharacterized protein n=2 Tax=Dactylosporangium darangshiense TaxID=579108 RepID=A0ABP8DC11_9ACTN
MAEAPQAPTPPPHPTADGAIPPTSPVPAASPGVPAGTSGNAGHSPAAADATPGDTASEPPDATRGGTAGAPPDATQGDTAGAPPDDAAQPAPGDTASASPGGVPGVSPGDTRGAALAAEPSPAERDAGTGMSGAAAAGGGDSPGGAGARQRPRSRSARDRARRRAVRAHAAQAGVAYSVAARQLAAAGLSPGELLGNAGRTVYPVALARGRWSIVAREERTAADKLSTTRTAARLPAGRARHLSDRFPPGEAAGIAFYGGELRAELLAMVYLVAAHEAPGLVPPPLDLAWTAELGEETAVDTACADLDRAARTMLEDRAAQRWHRIDAALTAAQHHPEPATRYAADLLTLAHRRLTTPTEAPNGDPQVPPAPWLGVRQTLDALLVVAEDGHAPGTRIRLPGKGPRREGTVIGAHWAPSGSPIAYDIALDDDPTTRTVLPPDMVVLPAQESDAPALTH